MNNVSNSTAEKTAETTVKNLRERVGARASIIGIITNFALSAMKFLVGFISGSVAIMADAINNCSDAGSSAVTLISFKLSAKPADRDHPFGHARIEYIASMIVSFLILKVGFDILVDSGKSIFFPSEDAAPVIDALTIVVLSVSIAVKLCLALYYRITGKQIGSDTLKAASTDSLFDVISTSAVLISSVVVKLTGIVIIDAIVGLCVSLLIVYAGIKILLETKNSLLGEAPVEETLRSIEEKIALYPEVIGVHDMMIHNYGPNHYIASFHAEVDGSEDIYMLHDVIDNLEKSIYNDLGIICTVHMDPLVTNDETVNELKAITAEAIKSVDESMRFHDFRAVVGNTHTNLIFDVVLPYESTLTEKEVRTLISNAVSAQRSDCFCVITVDRG